MVALHNLFERLTESSPGLIVGAVVSGDNFTVVTGRLDRHDVKAQSLKDKVLLCLSDLGYITKRLETVVIKICSSSGAHSSSLVS